MPAFVKYIKYIAICVPNTGNPFAKPLFPRRPSWKPSPLRPVISGQGRLSPFLPAENRCLFNFHPAGTTHAQKTDSVRKPGKRKTALAGGGLQRRRWWMFWSFTVREGRAVYFQSGGLEAGKTAVLFSMPEHGLRPGWTAVAGGGPKEGAVLLGWGSLS